MNPRIVATLAAVTLVALAGCGSGGAATSATTRTATVTNIATVTVTAKASPTGAMTSAAPPAATTAAAGLAWPEAVGAQGPAPSPPFPTALAGWEQDSHWRTLPRAFERTWSPVSGVDYGDFPATMNGCEDQRFMVRWRAVNPNASVAVRTNVGNVEYGKPVTGNAGWIDMDGCTAPEVRLIQSSDGSTLSDVTVTVQRWVPTP